MSLSKQQVKALLEVISSGNTRPVLEHAVIDDFEDQLTLVATDSYKLAAVKFEIPADASQDWHEQVGKFVSRDALTRWYKLASNRDMLGTEELLSMAVTDDMQYPKWQDLLLQHDGEHRDEPLEPVGTTRIGFDANYALSLQKLAGIPLHYTLQGSQGAMIAQIAGGTYILMPRRV